MAIVEVDGFCFLDKETIVIEQDKIEEYLEYIDEKQIKSVYLCNLYFRDEKIDFLEKVDYIEKLIITSTGIKDFSVLQRLKNLKVLSIDEPETIVDLSGMDNLLDLGITMNKYVKGVSLLKNLKVLRIYKFNPKSKDCMELSGLVSLEELKITGSNIESFRGLNSLVHLKKLELTYLRKMQYIDELITLSSSLRILEFDCCKKLINHEYVSCLSNLEKLVFNECGEMSSIQFITQLKGLKSFIFMKTKVSDGNFEPCEKLEYAVF